MITTLIDYDMANKLDLLKCVSKDHKKYIKDINELEITTEGKEGYNNTTSHITITYIIKNIKYTYRTYYNTSSIYALYLCDLYENISDHEDSELSEH